MPLFLLQSIKNNMSSNLFFSESASLKGQHNNSEFTISSDSTGTASDIFNWHRNNISYTMELETDAKASGYSSTALESYISAFGYSLKIYRKARRFQKVSA